MKSIWKYSFDVSQGEADITCNLPSANKLVCVREQGDYHLALWFEVETESHHTVPRAFILVGAGQEIPDQHEYVGTGIFQYGTYVLHVYEVPL